MTTIAFVWDNFGPMHVDRCEAVQTHLGDQHEVVGIEQFGTSNEYEWNSEIGKTFKKITVMESEQRDSGVLKKTLKLWSVIRQNKASSVFFCNYERTEILLCAILCRLSGRSAFVMGCSKFDDLLRKLHREVLKSAYFLPYKGGIASGYRSRDYMRFLGLKDKKIVTEYNTLSIERIRTASRTSPAPGGTPFPDRHFTIVARFVHKKNLFMALDAFAAYAMNRTSPRQLHLCGSGDLELELKDKVSDLKLNDLVVFRGFLQSNDIARVLGNSLALLLPSIEEQFGNVVIEAKAMGLPIILSDQCGARDILVRSGKNGFVVEPDNPTGMAFFMQLLSDNESIWHKFSTSSVESADQGDSSKFAQAVDTLIKNTSK